MVKNVVSEIVEFGFCVGCGVCAALCPSDNLAIVWNKLGEYQPIDGGNCSEKCKICLNVCPRFYENKNQHEIAKDQFGAIPNIKFENNAGYFVGCFAGYTKDNKLRDQAASGGLCTVFLKSLLDSGEVDGIICVKPVGDSKRLFEFFIASSCEQLFLAASSVYYPVEMSAVIQKILECDDGLRYVIVGLPCFLTSISLAQTRISKLSRIIKYKVGLVCGSLPNRTFNEKIFSQFNILTKSLQSIKYRDTSIFPNRLKGMKITDLSGNTHFAFNAHEAKIRRSGRFVYTACMFCSDIFAETADAVFMDAWLPEYRDDHFGTSFIMIRNPELSKVVKNIEKEDLAEINEINIEKITASQRIRINNKRQGLSYRLNLCRVWGIRYPKNIYVEENYNQSEANKRKIALKFVEHLKSHGLIRIKNKYLCLLLPTLLLKIMLEFKADLKEIIRKYYLQYKYLKKK